MFIFSHKMIIFNVEVSNAIIINQKVKFNKNVKLEMIKEKSVLLK